MQQIRLQVCFSLMVKGTTSLFNSFCSVAKQVDVFGCLFTEPLVHHVPYCKSCKSELFVVSLILIQHRSFLEAMIGVAIKQRAIMSGTSSSQWPTIRYIKKDHYCMQSALAARYALPGCIYLLDFRLDKLICPRKLSINLVSL